MKKAALIVDYFFPPLAGAGSQRTLGYVRYLSEFGWDPIVLTVRDGDHNFIDSSQLERIPPSVEVHRTPSLEPLRAARRLVGRRGSRPEGNGNGSAGGGLTGRTLSRLRTLEHWLLFPDRRVGWLPFAVPAALALCRRRPVALVFSTSTAITSHLIGYAVKARLGLPWVADFQDPWAELEGAFPSRMHRAMARRVESLIVRHADRVTATAEPLKEMLERRHGGGIAKASVVYAGYDPEMFRDVIALRRQKFTVTHFGNFYASRSPQPFLEGIGRCITEHPAVALDLEVLLLGTFEPRLRALAEGVVARFGLERVVRFEGVVPYRAGLETLVSSDILALIGDASPWARQTIPGKLYEYLAVGKPILALWPGGPAADIVRSAGAGVVVGPEDVEAVQRTIWDLYQRARHGGVPFAVQHEVVQRYACSRQAGELAAVFDRALATCQ